MSDSVEMEIIQGEDWTVDVIWTDNYDVGMRVLHPCKMTIKGSNGVLHTLVTNPDIPDGEVPGINLSTDIGLLQLHIPEEVTSEFEPGGYNADLFVTVDGGEFADTQVSRLFPARVTVVNRITEL